MQIFFMIMGAALGAWMRETERDEREEIDAELDKAWGTFWQAHLHDGFTDPERVLMDKLQSEGHPPPGWTWHKMPESAFPRSVLLPPGHVLDEGSVVQVFESEVDVVDDGGARRLGAHVQRSPPRGAWIVRPSQWHRGKIWPFKIWMHESPNRRDPRVVPFQFQAVNSADSPMTRENQGGFDIYRATRDLHKAGLLVAHRNGALLALAHRPDRLDASIEDVVFSALKSGYILVHSASFPHHFLLAHPVPHLPAHEPDALKPGSFRVRQDIDLREWNDEQARLRFRVGYGLPLERLPELP